MHFLILCVFFFIEIQWAYFTLWWANSSCPLFQEVSLKAENLSRQAQRKWSAYANVYPNTTSRPVPKTGGACVISSALNHNYSHVISKAWFIHQACMNGWSQDVRFRDVSENACCGYDFILSGLVMKDHFSCGEMISTQIYSWVTEESHILDFHHAKIQLIFNPDGTMCRFFYLIYSLPTPPLISRTHSQLQDG